MIMNVKQLLGEGDVNLNKWFKLSPDEEKAVIESIAGENAIRGNALKHSALHQYTDRGYIVICDMGGEAEAHPLGPVKN